MYDNWLLKNFVDCQKPVFTESKPTKQLRFNSVCNTILIPTTQDYRNVGIELWIHTSEFLRTKLEAAIEIQNYIQNHPNCNKIEINEKLYQNNTITDFSESNEISHDESVKIENQNIFLTNPRLYKPESILNELLNNESNMNDDDDDDNISLSIKSVESECDKDTNDIEGEFEELYFFDSFNS
jgi:hypothetical protein